MEQIEAVLKKHLTPDLVPDDDLNASIIRQAKENETMRKKRFQPAVAAALTVGILTAGTVSAYAAYHFLTPSQVADAVNRSAVAAAFEGGTATRVNETQRTAGYDVTFLGTVTGRDLISAAADAGGADTIYADRTYAVVAIANADGSPMPDTTEDDFQMFCVSALIHGKSFRDVNNGILNAGATGFVQDGVQYELFECDDLEIFSGMGVSLGVVKSFGQESSAFCYDADSGLYSINTDYDGMNALFELPLDITKADDAAANDYLEKQKETAEEESDVEVSSGNSDVDAWVKAFSDAYVSTDAAWQSAMANARLDDAYTQTVEMDADGFVTFSANDGEYVNWVGEWSYEAGVEVFHTFETDGTPEKTDVITITMNEDGTFTIRRYVPVQ